MQGIRFEHLADDTQVRAIGSLFRRTTGSQWGINLGFYPFQPKKSLTVSHAPVLARRRVFNPTNPYKQAGYRQVFSITDTSCWKVEPLSDCPILENLQPIEQEQLCFVFQAENGLTVYLPHFELARALFLHDGYLSRTALEPDSLKAEFDININSAANTTLINVMPSSTYPLISFNDPEVRSILSWILIDQEARASYESIGQYQKLTATESRGYRHWNFQFTPPTLPFAEFEVRGQFDGTTRSIFVYEVTAIRNIQAEMPELIEFYHPKFEISVSGSGLRGGGAGTEAASDFILEEEDASTDKGVSIFHPPPVEFSFSQAFKTAKLADRKRVGAGGRKDEESESTDPLHVSIEEATTTGSLRGMEWDSVRDTTDDANLYSNKFDAFWQMLDVLKKDYACAVLSQDIRKLPELPRCKKHLLKTNGSPRCMAIVVIRSEDQVFHLLEVDTSDEAKALSTLLLKLPSLAGWDDQLIVEIERKLLRQSLRWPTNIFRRVCGKGGYQGIPHPKTSSNRVVESIAITQWATRLHRSLVEKM
ncbi:hypothetical protein J7438_20720 [Thalassotalea sp. G20_0]|uniref:Tn7-like element transposition protein TnsE n=1 Tax=Thalassotalea sp. G20_0 TaxID=2821093 RepID=UPI001ADAB507|nr:Tn7-like element transposition protein TnsE [Thalassotalea sp. G20_0]MBO9496484.1 hypothetical protein [Thalassotalea sp. G20_0]